MKMACMYIYYQQYAHHNGPYQYKNRRAKLAQKLLSELSRLFPFKVKGMVIVDNL